MCGIAGVVSRSEQPVERAVLERMVNAVGHRGPDGEGFYVAGRVGLGHRRLAIIDLSPGGAQPMHCAKSGRVIVYNGEIYNYLELRTELQGRGYCFQSQSDTEVILAAYDQWGASCVHKFNGMWSFALLDQARDLVFCSRDRFGVKPFYYVDDPKFFAFGSELRQLAPFLNSRRASREVLFDFLSFSAEELGADTFFAGVRRLPAGHNLSFRIGAGEYSIERFYAVPELGAPRRLSATDASETLREILTDAVRLRLRSDVPVGTCLSGGLDSSSIAAIASSLVREAQGPRFTAITAASESPATDETEYARMVVDRADLNWHVIRPDFASFSDTLVQVVRAQEEPFSSPSVCMQFFVMQAAKQRGIPVLLDGQGGDETLLGYERYMVPIVRETYRNDGIRAAIAMMQAFSHHNDSLKVRSQLQMLAYFSLPSLRWLRYRLRIRDAQWFPSLDHFRRKFGQVAGSAFEIQRRQIERDSIPNLLRYEDKNSMWHSVETRLPFMDYRLVEFAVNLPISSKVKNGWTKFALRQAMLGMLPDTILWRRNKLGFHAPDDRWLPKLHNEMIQTIAKSELLKEACGPGQSAFRPHRLDRAVLWRFYVVALWEREFGVSGLAEA